MYCRPKIIGLNTTIRFVALYTTTNAIYIINIHCFRAVMEISCSEKSVKSETSNFGLRFYVFLNAASKKRKKSRCLDFQKSVKNVFSNYASQQAMGVAELQEGGIEIDKLRRYAGRRKHFLELKNAFLFPKLAGNANFINVGRLGPGPDLAAGRAGAQPYA